jgi:hypothetical protein
VLKVWLSDVPVQSGKAGWKVFNDGRHVDLGGLRVNKGSQNYLIPKDLAGYNSVTIVMRPLLTETDGRRGALFTRVAMPSRATMPSQVSTGRAVKAVPTAIAVGLLTGFFGVGSGFVVVSRARADAGLRHIAVRRRRLGRRCAT